MKRGKADPSQCCEGSVAKDDRYRFRLLAPYRDRLADMIEAESPPVSRLVRQARDWQLQGQAAEEAAEEANGDGKTKRQPRTALPLGIVTGDCLEVLPKLPAAIAEHFFADPPYNIGVDYGKGKKADKLPDDEYVGWCADWIAEGVRLLKPAGTFWLMCGDEYADYLALELRKAGLHRRAWIKWYETFGVCNSAKTNFNRCSRHLFYCVKNPSRFTFDYRPVSRLSDRKTKYKDRRVRPGGKVWDDVWPIPRLQGTSKERVWGVPTQLPLALVEAVVLSSSNVGNLVIDPFCGSGTTAVAALRHKRRFLGCEENPEYVEAARRRLKKEGLADRAAEVR
jgi:site-specific DNA-methyltransferase (adenine-specific)